MILRNCGEVSEAIRILMLAPIRFVPNEVNV